MVITGLMIIFKPAAAWLVVSVQTSQSPQYQTPWRLSMYMTPVCVRVREYQPILTFTQCMAAEWT